MNQASGLRLIGLGIVVVAALGLAAVGFLRFTPSTKLFRFREAFIPSLQAPSPIASSSNSETPPLKREALEEVGRTQLNSVPLNRRNPFQAPPVVKSFRETSTVGETGKRLPVEPYEPIRNDMPEQQPVWQGLLRTKADQLVIVRYAAKTHFLRKGDRLPESNYRLTEIEPDYILFISPAKQLRLARERKGN